MNVAQGEKIMPEKNKETRIAHSPTDQLVGWARQGIESFMAAQKILLDLTAQQNSLLIGMVREQMSKPRFRPGPAIAKVADKGVENITAAGKILLDLAAGETALVVDGLKEVVPLPRVAGTVANVVRHRVATIIDMQKRLLDAAAEQTHTVAEDYREGKGLLGAGASAVELARRGIETLVETEKKFLDLAAHEVSSATKGNGEGRKPARARYKVLTELAREGSEKYIEAQKKLLNLAIEQMESGGHVASERLEAAGTEARASWGSLTEKSVRNLVTAQKSLMDLIVKPAKATPAERKPKPVRVRPKRKVEHIELKQQVAS
jgi:hypothetical protein